MNRQSILLFAFMIFVSCSQNKPVDEQQTTADQISPPPPTPEDSNVFKMNTRMDTIPTDRFWMLVNKARFYANGNDSIKEHTLISYLEVLSTEAILKFEVALRKCIIDADNSKIMAAQKLIMGSVTDKSYLYFRCWLIGQGKVAFKEILKDPDYLATIVNKGDNCQWKNLLQIATKAFEMHTEKNDSSISPMDYAIAKGMDYSDVARPINRDELTNEQLPTLLPKL